MELRQTYDISSISKLLVVTEELSSDVRSSKRAADTRVLLTEIVLMEPGSDRNWSAIAGMNWFRDRYRDFGKISDEDMLYTLALFTSRAYASTAKLKWRDLTHVERCSMTGYLKNLGEVMGILYGLLHRTDIPTGQNGSGSSKHGFSNTKSGR